MFDLSSFANPTPLAHADTSRDVLPRGGTSHSSSPIISSYKFGGKRMGEFTVRKKMSVSFRLLSSDNVDSKSDIQAYAQGLEKSQWLAAVCAAVLHVAVDLVSE
ncbi:hypothetical protein TNCV_3868581 [Trichonephila clavipes]|nr:hypothetical protein TNCV_3868581 [Trichonephila clavipes]